MIVGALTGILVILVGDVMYKTDISIFGLIFGTIIACGVVRVIQFLIFDVDYSRTEKVQFEDDDYYYYVKAVPKITAGNIKDSKDSSDDKAAARRKALKSKAKEEAVREEPVRRAPQVEENEVEERNEEEERVPKRRPQASKPSSKNASGDFSREKAAYEARQAEIARRRELAAKREERMRVQAAEAAEAESDASEIVQEEDSDLGLSRRMAYQRRKLEERLNRDNK